MNLWPWAAGANEEGLPGKGGPSDVLLPGECVNDDGKFIDSMPMAELALAAPMPIRLSKNFIDALEEPLAA